MDEHVGRAVVHGLRLRGVDVVTLAKESLLGARDEVVLENASTEGRVLFTQDDDLLRMHADGTKHAGIVFACQGT